MTNAQRQMIVDRARNVTGAQLSRSIVAKYQTELTTLENMPEHEKTAKILNRIKFLSRIRWALLK